MIPKKEKFKTEDFPKMKNNKSKKLITKYGFFVIFEASSTDPLFGKKAIILSKKVYKTAVSRNNHKRIFYNCIRSLPELQTKSFVFTGKSVFTAKDLLVDLLKI